MMSAAAARRVNSSGIVRRFERAGAQGRRAHSAVPGSRGDPGV